ncbi:MULTISPECIES: DNA-processing protein DprA [Aeromonas]|jgi:DNA protecting protein DprA|uniref:DNA-processing protein DprA n=1 Tax=Aeromonas TaxID=642 RepID=UPI001A25A4E8|nr:MULTISPECIES: DNA-processing protein DprA [Aeromonas]HAT2491870.1 DNA-processing protein DprA [Aeromonas hydrophila]MDX7698269.1 DNA-processing protein DprA [Aeromonas dhakensis]HAT2496893.1 DNA-processing protein DprA [Aeromonas hydrophila]HAT2512008.1 DNA-processing protein DprA [Aeromonas hydrophila]HAT2532500.1 DNA-processing protein DprA [Aeromonas hydrophila]
MAEQQEYWKAETVAFYALQSLHGVGFKTLYRIAAQKISFRELIRTDDISYFEKMLRLKLEESIKNSPENWAHFKLELWSKGLDIARHLAKENVYLIFYGHESYPSQLKNITEPPMWLFVQGNISNLYSPSVAIIGSRKSSEDGLWLTKYIVATISNLGLVSVSGLAEGIDQKAHIESIRFGVPTVAILGTGIDSNYPRGSESIRADILANNGTIVSEYLLGESYSAYNFVRRNRIQAGLAETVVPVEWKIKSGTAHTVNFAKEFHRFIIMPYLQTSDCDSEEIKLVNQYSLGVAFKIPDHSTELTQCISNPKKLMPPHTELDEADLASLQGSLDL